MENLTFEDREIIINKIDKIKEISDLNNNSIAIDLILYLFLELNINYGLCMFEAKDIIEKLGIKDADDYIKKSLRDLVDKQILKITVDFKRKYYSLNEEYFIKNNI